MAAEVPTSVGAASDHLATLITLQQQLNVAQLSDWERLRRGDAPTTWCVSRATDNWHATMECEKVKCAGAHRRRFHRVQFCHNFPAKSSD